MVCGNCSARKFLLSHISAKPIRVCDTCYEKLSSGATKPTDQLTAEEKAALEEIHQKAGLSKVVLRIFRLTQYMRNFENVFLLSVMQGFCSTLKDIISTVLGYHHYIGGCSVLLGISPVLWRDTTSSVEGVQY